ncbi:microcephalin [Anaeramoeba flamelloides]|uniref:Microcephalin n=1 Tax=Anaeramoeba flamelloides TaxID=1746091 RepID=A0ABQ8YS35_9EUKA|nr:microcephalin [Anaeramoeba flamelloides]
MDDKFLNSLTIYIEVFTSEGTINSSKIFVNKLEKMGAVISKTFTNSVDLIVFKDGYLSTYNKAKKKEILLVSPLWVHKCESQNEKVDPKDFPASEINEALFSNRTPLDKLLGSRKKSRRRKTLNPLNTPSWHKSEKKIHNARTERKRRHLKSEQSQDEQVKSLFQDSKKHTIKQLFTDFTNTSDSQKSDFLDLNSNLNFNIFQLNGNLKEKKKTKKMIKEANEQIERELKITKKSKKNKEEGEEKRKEKQKAKDLEKIKQKKKSTRLNSNNSNFFHLNNSPYSNLMSTPKPRFKRSRISTPVPINQVNEDQKFHPNTPKLKKINKQNCSNKKQIKKKNRLRDTTNQKKSFNVKNKNKIQTPNINQIKKRRNAQLNTPTKQLAFQFDFEGLMKSVKKSQKKRRKKRSLKQK